MPDERPRYQFPLMEARQWSNPDANCQQLAEDSLARNAELGAHTPRVAQLEPLEPSYIFNYMSWLLDLGLPMGT